ncbi:hypothetical protein BCR39DRAFT_461494 [Naematelia encephala]|uniref:sterol 3beta-glucosyltransferase n=1 Tax=Naematelia encephala TaxID=71784 RepID=A0A1Y2BL31_9TREE|nr:hypothetical protein BCR39DRAFT_461494 [Naematelia encephala]
MDDTLGKTIKDREKLGSIFTGASSDSCLHADWSALSLSNLSPLSFKDQDKKTGKATRKHRPSLPRIITATPPPLATDSEVEESENPELEPPIQSSTEGSEDSTAYTSADETNPLAEQTNEASKPSQTGRYLSGSISDNDISDVEKLEAIIEEFGPIDQLMVNSDGSPSEPERLLADSKGSLFKGVMMIGNLHLTTHRLLFHAILPPDAAFTAPPGATEIGNDLSYTSIAHQSDVLQAGPVTIHRNAALLPPRRVWMELSAEMVTTYPSGDEAGRVRPLRCVLLSSVRRLEPLDPDKPCDFHVTYETPEGPRITFFSVDTEQSAIAWRRQFEAAIFRHARVRWRQNKAAKDGLNPDSPTDDMDGQHWTMMRCCLPLDRVRLKGVTDYHSFATLVGLDVELSDGEAVDWHPERSRDSSPDRPFSSSPRSSSPLAETPPVLAESAKSPTRKSTHYLDSTLPPRLSHAAQAQASKLSAPPYKRGDEHGRVFDFNVAVLNEQVWFAEALEAAVKASAHRKYKDGAKRPKMVLDIGGYDCLTSDDEVENPITGLRRTSTQDSSDLEDDDEAGKPSSSGQSRKEQRIAKVARLFGLKEDEGIWLKRCYISQGLVPARGYIILTPKYICFWRHATVGTDTKYRFKCSDIKGADEVQGIRAAFHGMALHIHGHHDLAFEFWQKSARDEAIRRIRELSAPFTPATILSPKSSPPLTGKALRTHAADVLAPPKGALFEPRAFPDEALAYMPFLANKPWNNVSRLKPRTFTMLTIGSRGDVQPYIALGLRLMKDDHKVVIVTHDEFKGWIEGYGIEHRQAGGDPTALMKLSAEHKMFSPGFFKESLGSFRQWLDDLLVDSWNACKDADVLIESPSAMAGVHIAEALKIPYFRAFTMPWTRTNAYPQAFMVPAFEMGPSFNYSTYVLYDNIIWRATSGQINRWRKKYLGIGSTDMSMLSVTKVPFLYNFSSAVVPKPLDWHDDITITGYWNLENSDMEWTPPQDLVDFMDKARADGKPLVYIGFGSIVVPRPNAMTKSIIKAVEKADVRAIVAKGWSSRGGDPAKEGEQIQFPASCYGLEKVPHGWLFPKIDAALHHGGAGTVGASLRAGIPTLIKPWFGDQFFWALRVTKLEVGLKVSSLRSDEVADALRKATSDRVMIEKAARIGERIRAENGVENAVQAITFNVIRAGGDRTKMRWGNK